MEWNAQKRNGIGAGVTVVISFFFFLSVSGQQTDPTNGYPSWRERGITTLVNACRMDPQGYRDAFVGAYNILLENSYQPVIPLYWNYNLNRSARAHAIDMANNCGLSHNSCDNTPWDSRILDYYENKSDHIGENVATGESSPQATMKQWLLDGNPPPADKTSDGHRKNIMDASFREGGAGYAYGSQPFNNFWVLDLGGGAPEIDNKIVCGTHFFFTTTATTFMAVFYDESGAAPSGASIYFGSTSYDLALYFGEAGKGVYRYETSAGNACRYYYFSFTDSQQRQWRYPEAGFLATFGEGECNIEYSTEITGRADYHLRPPSPPRRIYTAAGRKICIETGRGIPQYVEIAGIDGRRLVQAKITSRESGGRVTLSLPRKNILTPAIRIAVVHTDGYVSETACFAFIR